MVWRNITGFAKGWKSDIEKHEWKLQREINRHGFYSRQADHQRHELREARERCWRERERWEREHSWRRDRDWDRY